MFVVFKQPKLRASECRDNERYFFVLGWISLSERDGSQNESHSALSLFLRNS